MKKVCMKLNNAFVNDARVFKEATSLGQAGYRVVIIAKCKKELQKVDDYGDFIVKRIEKKNIIPLYSILKALWEEKPDIYHAHDLDSLPPTYLIAKLRGAKLVYDSHEYWRGFDEKKINWKRKVFLFFERLMVSGVDLLISVNPTITELIAKNYNYNGDKIVLFNAPLSRKENEESSIRPKSKVSILHTGAIQRGRGVDIALETLKFLPDDYSLYYLGPDNYPGGFYNLAKKLKVADRVIMLGAVPSTEVAKQASFADMALVLTQNLSENYYYSLPNKLFESISAGLPVVASDMFEISRLVNGEDIGEICDVSDPRDIARKIIKVYKEKDKFKEKVRQAAKKYCWENEEKKLLSAYRELA